MEQDCAQWKCNLCHYVGMADGTDGYFYCLRCGSQADDVIDTGVADEDFVDKGSHGGAVYLARHTRRTRQYLTPSQPVSQSDPQSQKFWSSLTQEHKGHDHDQDGMQGNAGLDGVGPTGTGDFGSYSTAAYSYEDYYQEVRNRHVMGLQMMIEAQCEALINKFNVKPLICGIAGTAWLKFVARSGVYNDAWADDAIHHSENKKSGEAEDFKPSARHRAEPHNIHGQRAVIIWHKQIRKKIPLSSSLAICFLACHIAREAVLATDIIKWSVEGEVTYFDAFVEIEKRIGQSLPPFPLSLRSMFRPSHAVSAQKLESLAATIAQCIGLNLPPLNFYAVASRYLNELSLPAEKILPHACHVYEWMMMPPELRLSTNNDGLPTHVYVMSILVITVRILYNINGVGVWEKSLSIKSKSNEAVSKDCASSNSNDEGFDAVELLCNLEARYNEINDGRVKCKTMPSYLQFCQDVVFAGSELPLDFYHVEKNLIDKLWDYYQKEKDSEPAEDNKVKKKLKKDEYISLQRQWEYSESESNKERAIRVMKKNMEQNKFTYIPPRVKLRRLDYLHYERKNNHGALTYVAHADYYILLRSCARVADMDMRLMHLGILSMERRLDWLEKRIDHCLHLTPPALTPSTKCKFCTDEPDQAVDDPTI